MKIVIKLQKRIGNARATRGIDFEQIRGGIEYHCDLLNRHQSFYRDRAIINAKSNNRWAKMNDEEKRKTVKNLLSPFKATEEEINLIVQEVDDSHDI